MARDSNKDKFINSKRYMRSWGTLYGDEVLVTTPVKKTAHTASKRRTCPPERKEQMLLAEWLDLRKDILYTASANGGLRSRREGGKLKAQGVKRGYPDIDIKEGRKGYLGLLIELKKQFGGVISPEQRWWNVELNKRGYLAVFANGFDEAVKIIEEYFR